MVHAPSWKEKSFLNSVLIFKGAIKQRETHTTGIEVSCPEVIEVAISFDRDKRRADSFNLLAIARARYKADIIAPGDEMFCNCSHGYDMSRYWRAAYQHEGLD